MPSYRSQADPVLTRTHATICKTYELIRRSDTLRATVQLNPLPRNGKSMLDWAIHSAMRITHAPRANLQIFDSASGALRIAAHHGFTQPFLDFFQSVHGEAACGRAFETGGRVTVEDVTQSPIFHGTSALEVLLDARVRAVQSTPLLDSSGNVVGILSTHWSSSRNLRNLPWTKLDILARTVGRWLELHPSQ